MRSGVVSANNSRPSTRRRKLDAVDDVAPLVRAAHLQHAVVAAGKLKKIVSLEQHVVEFEEGQRLLALKPQLHRIEGEHPIDGEVAAVFAQKIDVIEVLEPLVVIDEERICFALPESQELPEGVPDPRLVCVDLGFGQKLPALVLAGWIADLGRAAANQRDRPMPAALQHAKHHDADEIADMQAWRGAIEADIGGDRAFRGQRAQPFLVGNLMDVTALS